MYILSQILVGLADLLFVFSMLSKKKINLLIFLFFSDILFATHYLLLNSLTGSIIIFIDAVFLITTFLLEKYNKKQFIKYAAIITMIATIITGIFTWQGPISLLPMFSMLLYLTGLIFDNIIIVKTGALMRNLLNIIYLILVTSYVGAGLEFCLMISAIIGIIINVKNKRNSDKTQIENTEEQQK